MRWLIVFFPCSILASLYLGPYGGVEFFGVQEGGRTVVSDGITYDFKAQGDTLGYTYGIQWGLVIYKGLYIGHDYAVQNITWGYNGDDSSSFDDSWGDTSAVLTDNFLMLGYFRKGRSRRKRQWGFWIGYALSSSAALSKNINPSDVPLTYSGKTWKIGGGMSLKRYIRIDFEYFNSTYDSVTRAGTESSLPTTAGGSTYKEISHAGLIIRTVFPFKFFGRRR